MNTIDLKDQTRSSSQSSFLDKAMNSTRIEVYNGTLAKKIIFDGNKACGVSVNTSGTEYTLTQAKTLCYLQGR